MNLSAPFIARPIATALLTIAIMLAGALGLFRLPVSLLPALDVPAISVVAQLPGADANTVATSLAGPLERHLGQIADVTEMTSQSQLGLTRINLLFDSARDINGAARDVEAAINAARADLPTNLLFNPTYRRFNPAAAPVLIIALTSRTRSVGKIYDAASSVVAQQLSQIPGVGDVSVGGSGLPAVRVELQPQSLFKYGIGLEDVRAALAAANADSPKGIIDLGPERLQIATNDQALTAADFRPLIIAYRNGAPVRLADVAEVVDSVQDLRNLGLSNGLPAVLLIVRRAPGANIVALAEAVKAAVPALRASVPRDIDFRFALDLTIGIKASLFDTEATLVIAVILVSLTVLVFLRSPSATLIPIVAIPVSLVGTCGVMYLLGFSLDLLSLMALTVSTGFVVDDAIVVLENIARHMEAGMPRREAAILGAREVGFTIISITLSLVAVFLPILLAGGIAGRLLREFSVTLAVPVLISLVISLTTTPMLCALFLRPAPPPRADRRGFGQRALAFYGRSLGWTLRHNWLVLGVLAGTVALNVALFIAVPKLLLPTQDSGVLVGTIQADQGISFQAMSRKLVQLVSIVQRDPAVQTVTGSTGAGDGGISGQTNTGTVFVLLKPRNERDDLDAITVRLRRQLAGVPGARLILAPLGDLTASGRSSSGAYQYTLQSDDESTLETWAPKLLDALRHAPSLTDVSSDEQMGGEQTRVDIDRATASRLGLTMQQIDNTLYDAFGQRPVSTIYKPLNQYRVIMEVAPQYWQDPDLLNQMWISTSGGAPTGTQVTNAPAGTVIDGGAAAARAGVNDAQRNAAQNALAAIGNNAASSGAAVTTTKETMVPLAAVARFSHANGALAVNHQDQTVATTISFNLAPGRTLADAAAAIDAAAASIGLPDDIRRGFAGNALADQQAAGSELLLIFAALLTIYIVLGVLYESFIHPLTILSTLPPAGLGAVLALWLLHVAFSAIAAVGILLLIGIVKKNAILMVDFAITVERQDGASSRDAIFSACMTRFRPIMMTTLAALLGALPLALAFGNGSELERPLGITIVGGLIVSQVLTLYTTPSVYLLLDRLRPRPLRLRSARPAE
jgi:multidrug efflux pump